MSESQVEAMWDAKQYLRFADERAMPFFDLVERINHPEPRRVVDLGCGAGGLTATLVERWPEAEITGVDSSEEMIGRARKRAIPRRFGFERGDVAAWRADEPLDVIVSNACFHWIPDHRRLLENLAAQLAPDGVLAFQVPDNFTSPSHKIVRTLVSSPKWRDRLGDLPQARVESPSWYVEVLMILGLDAKAWRTTYKHLLDGSNPVLEWLAGTTLRPALTRLDNDDRQRFLGELAPLIAEAFPEGSGGTLYPFRRTFVVARLPG